MGGAAGVRGGEPGLPAAAGPVLIVGTAALDRVIRLPGPLAPGRKTTGEDRGARLGGGGANAAVALARAGRAVRLAAAIGTDPEGEQLLAELARAGVDISLVRRQPGASPRTLLLVDPAGERTVVRLSAPGPPAPPAPLAPQPASCLFVRGEEPGVAALMARMAPACLVVAQVPPGGPGPRPAHVLIGSESDLDGSWLADPFAAGRRSGGDRLRWVVVTRGGAGAAAYAGDGRCVAVPAAKAAVVDSTGAGDLFAAGLIHALLDRRPMERALRVGAAWGAAAVGWEGGAPGAGFPPPEPG